MVFFILEFFKSFFINLFFRYFIGNEYIIMCRFFIDVSNFFKYLKNKDNIGILENSFCFY